MPAMTLTEKMLLAMAREMIKKIPAGTYAKYAPIVKKLSANPAIHAAITANGQTVEEFVKDQLEDRA